MRDSNYVIAEVTRRTGLPEKWVDRVIRVFNDDISEFINQKKGYSINIPKVGRLSFRINAIDKYIQTQRRYKKFWETRLASGISTCTSRTIVASQTNIQMIDINILQCLTIKEEYLKYHAKYDRKAAYFMQTSKADMSRLLEYLDVEDITLMEARIDKIQKERVPKVLKPNKSIPAETYSDQKVEGVLSYLQQMQLRNKSENSLDEQQVPGI